MWDLNWSGLSNSKVNYVAKFNAVLIFYHVLSKNSQSFNCGGNVFLSFFNSATTKTTPKFFGYFERNNSGQRTESGFCQTESKGNALTVVLQKWGCMYILCQYMIFKRNTLFTVTLWTFIIRKMYLFYVLKLDIKENCIFLLGNNLSHHFVENIFSLPD